MNFRKKYFIKFQSIVPTIELECVLPNSGGKGKEERLISLIPTTLTLLKNKLRLLIFVILFSIQFYNFTQRFNILRI